MQSSVATMNKLENRSLGRGISILEVLGREGACALRDLHAHTGLPKSTIRRLLATLIEHRLVRRGLSDDLYRTNVILPACAGYPISAGDTLFLDVAVPIVTELTQQIKWPSDIHVWDGLRMRIVDSTRALSPFSFFLGVVDFHLNVFGTASGIACLSALEDGEISAMIDEAAADPFWSLGHYGIGASQFFEQIELSRERGYSCRLPTFFTERAPHDGLAVIAVPILQNGRPYGAITLLWPRPFKTVEAFAKDHLAALQAAAGAISERVAS